MVKLTLRHRGLVDVTQFQPSLSGRTGNAFELAHDAAPTRCLKLGLTWALRRAVILPRLARRARLDCLRGYMAESTMPDVFATHLRSRLKKNVKAIRHHHNAHPQIQSASYNR